MQSGTLNNSIIDTKLSDLERLLGPRQESETNRSNYFGRIYEGFNLASKLAEENRDDIDTLTKLHQTLKKIISYYPIINHYRTILEDHIAIWETLGLNLCLISNIFIDLFPSIRDEWKKWSLLDFLQNEIICFYHYSDHLQHATQESKMAAARKAM